MAERYLLTWMADEKEIYDAVKGYLTPEDFNEGFSREMASRFYEAYEAGSFSAADILTVFAAEDKAKEASAIINMPLDDISSPADRERALTDLVVKIKKASLQRQKNADDGRDPLKKAKEEKQALSELKKIKITI